MARKDDKVEWLDGSVLYVVEHYIDMTSYCLAMQYWLYSSRVQFELVLQFSKEQLMQHIISSQQQITIHSELKSIHQITMHGELKSIFRITIHSELKLIADNNA